MQVLLRCHGGIGYPRSRIISGVDEVGRVVQAAIHFVEGIIQVRRKPYFPETGQGEVLRYSQHLRKGYQHSFVLLQLGCRRYWQTYNCGRKGRGTGLHGNNGTVAGIADLGLRKHFSYRTGYPHDLPHTHGGIAEHKYPIRGSRVSISGCILNEKAIQTAASLIIAIYYTRGCYYLTHQRTCGAAALNGVNRGNGGIIIIFYSPGALSVSYRSPGNICDIDKKSFVRFTLLISVYNNVKCIKHTSGRDSLASQAFGYVITSGSSCIIRRGDIKSNPTRQSRLGECNGKCCSSGTGISFRNGYIIDGKHYADRRTRISRCLIVTRSRRAGSKVSCVVTGVSAAVGYSKGC